MRCESLSHGCSGRAARLLVLAATLIPVAGCATLTHVPATHIVMVNGRGNPVDPTGNIGCRGKPDSCKDPNEKSRHLWILPAEYRQMDRTAPVLSPGPLSSAGPSGAYSNSYDVYLKALLEDLTRNAPTRNNRKQLLIYIHGGLNTQVGTVERAVELMDAIPKTEYYPIFINWQSSLFSSYADHLVHIRQGESWDGLGLLTTPVFAPVYFTADVARAIARAPIVWYFLAQNWVKSIATTEVQVEVNTVTDELEREYRQDPTGNTLKIAYDKQDYRRPWQAMLAHATATLTIPTKLIGSMFVDAFGKSSWDVMLRRTHMLYHTEREFFESGKVAIDERKPDFPTSHIKPDGAVSVFVRRLSELIRRTGGAKEWEITLVGHSMGTIVLNQLIRDFGVAATAEPGGQTGESVLPFDHIIYMAGATTVRDYQDTVFPYLRSNPRARMFHLTLHPKSEIRERFDPGIPYLDLPPRGSLLVWVDEFLSNPETVLDRTVGRFENLITAIHNTPDELRGRVHIKAAVAGRDAGGPQKHSDFTEYLKFWRAECWWSPGVEYPPGCYDRR